MNPIETSVESLKAKDLVTVEKIEKVKKSREGVREKIRRDLYHHSVTIEKTNIFGGQLKAQKEIEDSSQKSSQYLMMEEQILKATIGQEDQISWYNQISNWSDKRLQKVTEELERNFHQVSLEGDVKHRASSGIEEGKKSFKQTDSFHSALINASLKIDRLYSARIRNGKYSHPDGSEKDNRDFLECKQNLLERYEKSPSKKDSSERNADNEFNADEYKAINISFKISEILREEEMAIALVEKRVADFVNARLDNI